MYMDMHCFFQEIWNDNNVFFIQKLWNDIYYEYFTLTLKVFIALPYLTMSFYPPLRMWQISTFNSSNATSTIRDDVIP